MTAKQKQSISTMKKYIEQTHKLDDERKSIVQQMTTQLMTKDEHAIAQKRLVAIYHTQSSNAVILADMLQQTLNETK